MTTYAMSDLHGIYELWSIAKDIIKPEDKLIFLGDAIDRGPDGIKIMQELLERPNTIYLLGNHEDMMYNSIKEFSTKICSRIWDYNGGVYTFRKFLQLNEDEQEYLLNKIEDMPVYYKYTNPNGKIFLCSHSGALTDPWDRKHFLKEEEIDDNVIILHGHTPIRYLEQYITPSSSSEYPFWYNKNKKCCIDCWSYHSGNAILFNLDTLETTLIKTS